MNNLSRAVLALFFAVPIFGQSTVDYGLTLRAIVDSGQSAARVPVGQQVLYEVRWSASDPIDPEDVIIEVDVPGGATRAYSGFGISCAAGNPVVCTLDETAGTGGFVTIQARPEAAGTYTATARVIHRGDNSDPDPSNDKAIQTITAVALPSLQLTPSISLFRVEPGAPEGFGVRLQNAGGIPATNVVLTVSLPAGGTILGTGETNNNATCGITNNALVCTVPSLPQDLALRFNVSFIAPTRLDGADLVIRMSVTSAEEDFDPSDNQITRNVAMVRQFIVTNVENEGAGSLRQAMIEASMLCGDPQACAVVFRISAPVPANGWFTIQPRTPLPTVSGILKMDGDTQRLFTGNTNQDGPEIEINGALAPSHAGLRLIATCDMQISNLAVNGFPGYGIEVRKPEVPTACAASFFRGVTLRGNYLGTDPRGRIAKPNNRGLGLFCDEAFVYGNVIGGNRRAGIYAQNGFYADISGNLIGIGPDKSRLGNGAGILVDMGFGEFDGSGADIRQNAIAYNDGMAIARTRRGQVFISGNAIYDNLQQGIDIDIDGPSAQRADDVDAPSAPVLFSATYDPARNATIVRGRIDSAMLAHTRNVEIYASSRLSVWATPQAERGVATEQLMSGNQDFEIVVPEDLRGKWITATYNGVRFIGFARTPGGIGAQSHRELHPADTSELSNAVMAQ
ncbi:MAG: hypothetical protein ACJ74H_14445 [Thermoanaerobaculia bacterium]